MRCVSFIVTNCGRRQTSVSYRIMPCNLRPPLLARHGTPTRAQRQRAARHNARARRPSVNGTDRAARNHVSRRVSVSLSEGSGRTGAGELEHRNTSSRSREGGKKEAEPPRRREPSTPPPPAGKAVHPNERSPRRERRNIRDGGVGSYCTTSAVKSRLSPAFPCTRSFYPIPRRRSTQCE